MNIDMGMDMVCDMDTGHRVLNIARPRQLSNI
jgi:hypothetical protein